MPGKTKDAREFLEKVYQINLKESRLTPEEIKKHDYKERLNNRLKNKRLREKTGRVSQKQGYTEIIEKSESIIYQIYFPDTEHNYIGVSCTKPFQAIQKEIEWKLNNNKFGNSLVQGCFNAGYQCEVILVEYVLDKKELYQKKVDYILEIPEDLRLNRSYRLKIEKLSSEQTKKVEILNEQEKEAIKSQQDRQSGYTKWVEKKGIKMND